MVKLENNILKSENLSLAITSIKKVELKIIPVKKDISETVLNSLANTLSQSLSNGNEPVQIVLHIVCNDQSTQDIIWNKEPLIRNNLDYHRSVKEARSFQEQIQKLIS